MKAVCSKPGQRVRCYTALTFHSWWILTSLTIVECIEALLPKVERGDAWSIIGTGTRQLTLPLLHLIPPAERKWMFLMMIKSDKNINY